jgi:hypothetical protein
MKDKGGLTNFKLKGLASIEYLIVCTALILALLTPVENGDKNVMEICVETLTEWYTAFAYSKSLSILPN